MPSLCALQMNECAPAHSSPTTRTILTPHQELFCPQARLWCAHWAAGSIETHFVSQLFHPTCGPSYIKGYYSLIRPNIDACVYTERQADMGEKLGKRWGCTCSPAIMREATDNIWVLNWYRLTKYPDREEKAAVLSCAYIMSAQTSLSCTATIWSILIQTSSLPGPCPNLIFNTVWPIPTAWGHITAKITWLYNFLCWVHSWL